MKILNPNIILAGAIVFSAALVSGAMIYSADKNTLIKKEEAVTGDQIEESLSPSFEGAEEAGNCGV